MNKIKIVNVNLLITAIKQLSSALLILNIYIFCLIKDIYDDKTRFGVELIGRVRLWRDL